MKYLKMIGLAAVAAMALMAFVGVGTASANELCTENVSPCPAGKVVTEIDATIEKGTSANLVNTKNESIVTCTAGTMFGKVTSQGAGVNPIKGNVEKLTWGESGTNCTFPVTTIKGGTLSVSGTGNATVASQNAEVTVNTVLFGSCVYGTGAGTNLGTFTGGTPAKLDINTVVNLVSGGFACPTTAKWTGTYQITNHTSVFIVAS